LHPHPRPPAVRRFRQPDSRLAPPRHASPRLLADIGGTNARFALELGPGRVAHIEVLACAAYPTLADAMRAYLALPAVAAAGPCAMRRSRSPIR
jgi:hypothetical protein